VKNSVTASSSSDGNDVTSTTASTPASASSTREVSGSVRSKPVRRAISTTSCPSLRARAVSGEPTWPVSPAMAMRMGSSPQGLEQLGQSLS